MHISNIITKLLFFDCYFFYNLVVNMMKPLLYLSVLIFSLSACKQQPGKPQPISDTLLTKPVVEIVKADSTVQQQNAPVITPLPFGPRTGPKKLFNDDAWQFYIDIIGDGYVSGKGYKSLKPVMPLPPIEKYIYTVVDTVYDPRACNNEVSMDSLFKVKTYQLRLPDHEGFEVYYLEDIAGINEANKNLSPGFNGRCANFDLHFYGLLIYYQRATKTARLLPVYYNWYGDSEHERHFYIDTNYRVTLAEKIYSEGDFESKNPVDVMNGGSYKVRMKKTGVFEVKKFGE